MIGLLCGEETMTTR